LAGEEDAVLASIVVAAIAAIDIEPRDRCAGETLDLAGGGMQGVPVIRIAWQRHHAEDEAAPVRHGDTDLDAELVLLVRLAFGEAFDLGSVQGIELAGVVPLLGEQPIDQGEGAGKVRRQGLIAGELAPDVARHPAEKGLEPLDFTLGTVVLAGMQIRAGLAQRPLAEPRIALAQAEAVPGGEADQDLAATMIEPGIGGMGYRLRLVSTVTRSSSFAATTPPSRPASMVALSRTSMPLGPIRSRQRVIEERSIGRSC
jgi:hypothetical protein